MPWLWLPRTRWTASQSKPTADSQVIFQPRPQSVRFCIRLCVILPQILTAQQSRITNDKSPESQELGGIKAVNDASLEIKTGSITGLIGLNGAGKTALFNVIAGHYKPTSGTVTLDGEDIRIEPHQLFAKGLCALSSWRMNFRP